MYLEGNCEKGTPEEEPPEDEAPLTLGYAHYIPEDYNSDPRQYEKLRVDILVRLSITGKNHPSGGRRQRIHHQPLRQLPDERLRRLPSVLPDLRRLPILRPHVQGHLGEVPKRGARLLQHLRLLPPRGRFTPDSLCRQRLYGRGNEHRLHPKTLSVLLGSEEINREKGIRFPEKGSYGPGTVHRQRGRLSFLVIVTRRLDHSPAATNRSTIWNSECLYVYPTT